MFSYVREFFSVSIPISFQSPATELIHILPALLVQPQQEILQDAHQAFLLQVKTDLYWDAWLFQTEGNHRYHFMYSSVANFI